MKSDVDSYQYVKKNGNSFSFMSAFFDLIGNAEYGKEAYSTLCTDVDTSRNNIWRSLSATASYVGEAVNNEILNYVDNICNVELCKIQQLQSLASYFGIKYSIFQNIQLFPRELIQLMDVLSIKREYLDDKLKVDHELADMIDQYAQLDDQNALSAALSVNNERTLSGFKWPDRYDNSAPVSVDFGKHLDDNMLVDVTYIIVNNFLQSKLYMTYNDSAKTMICKHLSTDILQNDFKLQNPNEQEIHDYKLQWNISKDFDQAAELDKIENGEAQLADYSNYEQHIIQLEKDGRDIAFDATQLATRFKYRREAEVREYYKFIESEYYNKEVARLYSTAKQYDVDNNYIELQSLDKVDLLCQDGTFNVRMLKVAADEIVNTIEELRDIREQIKTLAQKNFMKGTFMLMSYAINEYLNKTVAPACKRISNTDVKYDPDTTTTDIVEYIDPTEYYNISCANDSSTQLNARYWETGKAMQAIGAIDDTNIFAMPPTVDSQNIAFDSTALEQFYLQTLQSKFAASPKEAQSCHLYSFLCSIFDYAADATALSNVKLYETSNLTEYKTELFKKYTGLEDSDVPYANLKNIIHPSYQIHPYLSTFVEKYDYSYPVQNIVNATSQSILKDLKENIDQYIDDNGYLINLWKNPLNTNSDYISRYESTSHLDVNNNQNKYFGYDGLFHPDALKQLIDNPAEYIASIVPNNNEQTNCYAGLDLTYDECQRLQKQLSELSSAIKNEAEAVHDIYQYGLDAYGNAYILVKDYGLKSIDQLSAISTQTKKSTPGKLWMKLKNHPLALPAYVLKNDSIHTESISQLAVNGSVGASENARFTYKDIQRCAIEGTDYQTPLLYDFSISEDKTTFIAIAAYNDDKSNMSCQLPILAVPSQKSSSELGDNSTDITLHSLDKVRDKNSYIEELYSANEISDFQFQCFFNKGFGIGAAYLSSDNQNAIIKAAYYNTYTYEEHNNVKLPAIKVELEHSAIDGEVTVDSYVDKTTGTSKLVMSYLARTDMSECSTYMSNDFDYDQLSNYIETVQNKIVTRDIVIADNSLIKEREQVFAPFCDIGCNPVLPESNTLAGSKLESALTAFPTVMKFQLIGPQKAIGIDFINVLPVRMFDDYSQFTDDALSCADYRYIHFDEQNFEAIEIGSAPIYDSVEFAKLLSETDFTLRIDESYKNALTEAGYSEEDLVDNLISWPYLWNTKSNADFPQQFVNAYNPVEDGSMDDNMEIVLHEDHSISCSWKKSNDKIQLDFNSLYYTHISSLTNVFNRQHKFLSLKKAGEAGYLQEYNEDDQLVATYYIKNISDDKPKFLLSASFESQIAPSNYSTIVTEDDTRVGDENYYREPLVLVINNREYDLEAEDL